MEGFEPRLKGERRDRMFNNLKLERKDEFLTVKTEERK